MSQLSTLLNQTLEYYQNIQDKEYVLNPAIPILYLGDVNAYLTSTIKIVTVGKNPSFIEFCRLESQSYSFFRFPEWESKHNLSQALNSYFDNKPYECWFNSYEAILNGIDASYYTNSCSQNRAIHTDICSPIPTNPTWSKLPTDVQESLFTQGFKYWQKLIKILQPDIILLSITSRYLEYLNLTNKTEFKRFKRKTDGSYRKKHYIVYQYNYSLNNDKTAKVFFGQAAQKPFGTLSDSFKIELGQKILDRYR